MRTLMTRRTERMRTLMRSDGETRYPRGATTILIVLATQLLLPATGVAQATVSGLRPALLRPGLDSLSVTGVSAGVPIQPMDVAQTLARGTGALGDALIEVRRVTLRSSQGEGPALTGIDSIVFSAIDLRFRRAHSVQRYDPGETFVDVTVSVRGAALERVVRQAGRSDTTRAVFTAQPPLALPLLVMRAAPLSINWHATYEIFVPNAAGQDQVKTVQVDSVRLQTVAGRRVWVAHSRLLPDLHWTVIIDSLGRDLVGYRARRGDSLALTFSNRRFREPAVAVARAAPLVPRDIDAMRALVGHYYLEGVREMGSELLLRKDGTFDFMLSYGALDEEGGGEWRLVDGAVVLNTPGTARPPSVRLESASGVSRDSLVVLVVDSAGQPLSGLTLDFSRPGDSRSSGQSSREGYTHHFEKGRAPTVIGLGVDALGFRTPFDISGKPRALYRFVFLPGDLGRRRFSDERFTVEPGRLVMTLNGRAMKYVRH